jgi:hypothetical protein
MIKACEAGEAYSLGREPQEKFENTASLRSGRQPKKYIAWASRIQRSVARYRGL